MYFGEKVVKKVEISKLQMRQESSGNRRDVGSDI